MGEIVTKVTLVYRDGDEETYEATNVVGASGSYPYWVIWEPEQADGKQTCHFIPADDIKKVSMTGLPEKDEKTNLVPLRGGKDLWDSIDA